MPQPNGRRRLSPDDLARHVADHISTTKHESRRLILRDSVFVGRLLGGLVVALTMAGLVASVALGSLWLYERAAAPPDAYTGTLPPISNRPAQGDSVLGVTVTSGLPGSAPTSTSPSPTLGGSPSSTSLKSTSTTLPPTTTIPPTTTTTAAVTTTTQATTTTTAPTTTTSCHGQGQGNGNCN